MPDLTCSACRERLPWYVAGRLAQDERSAVAQHLANCADCEREAALWRAVAAQLTDEDQRIPLDTHADQAWLTLRSRLPQQRRIAAPAQQRKGQRMDPNADSLSAPDQPDTPPRRPSRRAALALPAAVALIALAVALYGLFGAQLRRNERIGASVTPTPTACASDALGASLPPNAIISDISMTSPRDGWAVGWVQQGGPEQTVAPKTLLLRFQNCQWQPTGESIAAAELFSVSMSSATDGWAVGATVIDESGAQAPSTTPHSWGSAQLLALHYVDGQWQRASLPSGTSGFSAKVRMTASGDGWMLIDSGKSHTDPYTVKNAYTLLHYQSGAWTPVPLTFDTSGALELWDVAALAPDDCWVVGYGTTASETFAVAHYHQGVWTTWSASQLGMTYPTLYAITMSSPTDVWVAGSYGYQDATGDHSAPLALRYDGVTWTREPIGDYGDQHEGHDIMTLAAQAPTELWAFPQTFQLDTPRYHMAHGSNGVWTWVAATPDSILSVNTAVFVSESEGFAAAETQTPTGRASILLHYANGAWSAIPAR